MADEITPQRRRIILCLAPQEPWPPTDGGKEGIHGAVAALARQSQIVLACPGSTITPAAADHYGALGIDYRPVPYIPRDSAAVVLSATLRLKPFKFHKYATTEALTLFGAVLGDIRPDAIICFHAHMEGLGQNLRRTHGWRAPLLVREHNIEYELLASYLGNSPFVVRSLGAPVLWMTRREEERIWRRASAVAFLSDRDLATAKSHGRFGRMILAPEGVPIPSSRGARMPMGPPQLLVPLNPKAPQSVANFRRFIHEYWLPLAETDALRSISLAVTGVDSNKLASLTDVSLEEQYVKRIRALGFLESLAPAFTASLAVVAPTFVGGGIRKKVLEAMANEVPVIASDLDIATCDYFKNGVNILRLGTPLEFTATVVRLLEDDDLWINLSRSGRKTVEQFANWGNFAEVIISEIDRLIDCAVVSGTTR